MRRAAFHYHLPGDLIAQRPLAQRTASRLLVLNGESGTLEDRRFEDLEQLLRRGDLLVLNDTRVIPARLYGRKDTGGRVEILIEKRLAGNRSWVFARSSKPTRPGRTIRLEGGGTARVIERAGDLLLVEFDVDEPLSGYLEKHGHVPLPPYIRRPDECADRERYQTVFARREGAAAAPTAGLHFDRGLLERLAELGIETATVTLHVGAGTFQPVRAERVEDHRLHAEESSVSAKVCRAVEHTRARGGRVVAVGTTVVRALEAAAADGLKPFSGETRLFIYPGFEFRAVDALVTNFHLPESSLLMLVCAFGGTGPVLAAYRHAVAQRYRFFSYGDAMFLTRRAP